MFSNVVLSSLSSFAIISLRKAELDVYFNLCFCCHIAFSVLCIFLAVLGIGLWSLSVTHTVRI